MPMMAKSIPPMADLLSVMGNTPSLSSVVHSAALNVSSFVPMMKKRAPETRMRIQDNKGYPFFWPRYNRKRKVTTLEIR
jgi:hypothetical protein